MTDTTAGQTATGGHITGFGSKGYRTYVLIALMLVYTLNFIDRTLISVVAQPIINTFQLNDTQWGLLSGPPFDSALRGRFRLHLATRLSRRRCRRRSRLHTTRQLFDH